MGDAHNAGEINVDELIAAVNRLLALSQRLRLFVVQRRQTPSDIRGPKPLVMPLAGRYTAHMDSALCDRMAERFQLTLALFEFGESMLRQRLRRKHPTASDAEIDRMVMEWVQRRPGAEGGDCPGRVRSWPLE